MKSKKLKITIISITILAIAAIICYKLINNNSNKNLSSNNKIIVATYKGGKITLQQAQMELNKIIVKNPDLKGLNFSNLNANQKEMVIKEIVLKELAYREAKKQKVHKTQSYKQALRLFETEALKQQLFLKLANDAKKEENLKKNYDKLVKELKDKKDIRISYIALKTQNEANSVHRILSKYPKSFASQAKKKSIDKEIAKKGGDLGFVLEDALPKEILNQVNELKKEQISQPFKLADKWVIIKLEGKRPAQIAKFEDAKEALSQSLSLKAVQDFVLESIKEADIRIVVE